MRVIAGAFKGRRLSAPTWEGLRPTSDRLRETLFDILAPRIAGARVLDGYAGTGAVGIEALSRGAADVVFVERDRRAQGLIAANLAHCGIANGYAIIRADTARAVVSLRAEIDRGARPPFDVIVLDPPYDEPADAVVGAAGGLLAEGGVLVLEHARRRPAPAAAGPVVRTREVTAGESVISFYTLRT